MCLKISSINFAQCDVSFCISFFLWVSISYLVNSYYHFAGAGVAESIFRVENSSDKCFHEPHKNGEIVIRENGIGCFSWVIALNSSGFLLFHSRLSWLWFVGSSIVKSYLCIAWASFCYFLCFHLVLKSRAPLRFPKAPVSFVLSIRISSLLITLLSKVSCLIHSFTRKEKNSIKSTLRQCSRYE